MNTASPIPRKHKVNKPVRNSIQNNNGVTFLFSNTLSIEDKIRAVQYLHNDITNIQDWVYVINASAFRTGNAIDGNVFGFVRTPRANEDYIRVPYFARPSSLGGWSHDKRGNRQVGCTEMYIFEDDSIVLWHNNTPFQFDITDLEEREWQALRFVAFLNYKIETSVIDPKHENDVEFCEDWGIERRTRFIRAF